MARRRNRRTGLRTVNDIDVTPLMDLTFLLLIVFMITAPTLEYETGVNPPGMATDTKVKDDQEPIMVNLDKDGVIWLHKAPVQLTELTTQLAVEQRSRPEIKVLVRADQARPYGDVIEIMKAVRKANILKVSLVTEAES